MVEVEVGGLAWCLGVWEGVWEWLGWLCEAQRGGGTCAAWKTVLEVVLAGKWGPGLGEKEGQWGVLEGVLGRQGVREWRLGVGWWSRGMEGE